MPILLPLKTVLLFEHHFYMYTLSYTISAIHTHTHSHTNRMRFTHAFIRLFAANGYHIAMHADSQSLSTTKIMSERRRAIKWVWMNNKSNNSALRLRFKLRCHVLKTINCNAIWVLSVNRAPKLHSNWLCHICITASIVSNALLTSFQTRLTSHHSLLMHWSADTLYLFVLHLPIAVPNDNTIRWLLYVSHNKNRKQNFCFSYFCVMCAPLVS